MLERTEVEKYLECIKDIKKSYALFDMHVHPFDVMCDGFTYTKNLQHEGIYSVNSSQYAPPTTGQLKISQLPEMTSQQLNPELREKMAILTARRLYAHTGTKLFADHMQLSGIDKILLLPVLSSDESDDLQMKMLYSMFGDNDRFALGYCIPNNVANNEIRNLVRDAVHSYKIKAIKIHPNITEIDLSESSGKERVEYIIEAASKAGLRVVIHGGRSTGIKDPMAASYGILKNLQHIDWGNTNQAVIIAHAGTYGHDLYQIKEEVLPLMNKLLSRHSNVFVDVSGLELDAISAIVTSIDMDRIFFGSDALYNSQWGALVKLMHVLQNNAPNYEECFVKIASLNPARHFFAEKHATN
jgi:predicted TIM-barrel fold metal-dependent hydrolase